MSKTVLGLPAEISEIEIKGITINGGIEPIIEDEEKGIVTAFVSVTGIEDKVKDIIEPGSYADTLTKRMPKGIRDHDWKSFVSKPLEIKELLPGDSELPKAFADGTPWPIGAGALRVKAQYNMGSSAGRDAFADAKFLGADQEWSIGYNVPKNGATKDAQGVRHIKSLDLWEYSMVLWGANPHARTLSVKDLMGGGIGAIGDDDSDSADEGDADETGRMASAKAAQQTLVKSIEDAFAAGALDRKDFRTMYAAATKSGKPWEDDADDDDEEEEPKKGKRAFAGAAPPFKSKKSAAIVLDADLAEAISVDGLKDDDAEALKAALKEMEDAANAEARTEAEDGVVTILGAIKNAADASDEGVKGMVNLIASNLLEVFESKGWTIPTDDQIVLDTDTKDDKIVLDTKSFEAEFDMSQFEGLLK